MSRDLPGMVQVEAELLGEEGLHKIEREVTGRLLGGTLEMPLLCMTSEPAACICIIMSAIT